MGSPINFASSSFSSQNSLNTESAIAIDQLAVNTVAKKGIAEFNRSLTRMPFRSYSSAIILTPGNVPDELAVSAIAKKGIAKANGSLAHMPQSNDAYPLLRENLLKAADQYNNDHNYMTAIIYMLKGVDQNTVFDKASDHLRQDPDFLLEATYRMEEDQQAVALEKIDFSSLANDGNFMIEMIKALKGINQNTAFDKATDNLRQDPDFVLKAINPMEEDQQAVALKKIDPSWTKDRDFMLDLIGQMQTRPLKLAAALKSDDTLLQDLGFMVQLLVKYEPVIKMSPFLTHCVLMASPNIGAPIPLLSSEDP